MILAFPTILAVCWSGNAAFRSKRRYEDKGAFSAMEFSHKPVLLTEAIDALEIKLGGIYVDGTAGGGGPSR